MTTRFWMVRHGPTGANGAIGWTDLPADLSDTRRVSALKAALPSGAVVVSSDLKRTIATADAVCDQTNRLPHDPALREIHFGTWEGQDFEDIHAADPKLTQAYWDRPGDVAPPDGESWNDLCRRVSARISELATNHAAQDVICVVHFGVILAALQIARDLSASSVMGFKIDPLSLTRLDYLPQTRSWRVLGVNQNY